jgi:hypothetical protein
MNDLHAILVKTKRIPKQDAFHFLVTFVGRSHNASVKKPLGQPGLDVRSVHCRRSNLSRALT